MKPLGSFCEFKYGRSLAEKDRRGGEFPVYGSNGVVGFHDTPLTSGPAIIIGRKGSVGALQYSDKPCFPIDTTYYVDRSCTQVNLRWLFFMLQPLGLNLLNKHVAVPGLNRDDAYEKELLVPDADEQRRIAAVLDKTDSHRRQRQESLPLSEALLQSAFTGMFGSETDPRCPRVKLSDHIDFITSGGRGWAKYYSTEGDKFIRSLDVQMNEINDSQMIRVVPPNNAEADRTRVRVGDVLLTITGSLIGRVAPVTEAHGGAFVSQHVAILRTHGFRPGFLSWAISTQEGQRQIQKNQTGQTKPGLNFEQIGRLTVPRPPEKLEEDFCNLIEKRRTILAQQRDAFQYANKLFASVQQRAFRGELDLSRLALDSPGDASLSDEPQTPVAKSALPRAMGLLLQAPQAIEVLLSQSDDKVSKGEQIEWSPDYFKYRVLSTQPAPFSFAEVMQRAESVFDDPSYEEINDIILGLLGQGASRAVLSQRFDVRLDESTQEVAGRKEIVFEPTR
jgi:type I restriction enzyme S subunit